MRGNFIFVGGLLLLAMNARQAVASDWKGFTGKEAQHRMNEALWFAASDGNLARAEEALAAGAEINWWFHNENALIRAAHHGHLPVVKMLLERGADIDAMHGSKEHTALMRAAYSGHYEVVKFLIEKGAHLHQSGKMHGPGDHRNAVEWSEHHGHHDMAELLRNAIEKDLQEKKALRESRHEERTKKNRRDAKKFREEEAKKKAEREESTADFEL